MLRLHSEESQNLAKSILLEESGNPILVRVAIWFSLSMIVLFIIWASLTRLDEVASAPGVIVPSGQVQQVQHIEGGRIKELLVQEGELVEKGQVLMRLDALEHETQFQQWQDKRGALLYQHERLLAFIEGRSPDFSNLSISPAYILEAKGAGPSAKEGLEHQINQAKAELAELNARESTLRSKAKIFKEEFSIAEGLYKDGLLSRANLLALERQYAEINGEVEQIPAQRNRIETKIAGFRDQAVIDLEAIKNELTQIQEEIRRRERLVALSEIRAPAAGVVLGMKTHTIGGVIAAGDTILEIVPRDRKLIAEVQISPADIGHIKVGQPVTIKFTSYDFARYGGIEGTLERISASTLVDEGASPFFKGVVAFEGDNLNSRQGQLPVLTGMTLIADIRTGDKTVMEYILKPIYASSQSALRER